MGKIQRVKPLTSVSDNPAITVDAAWALVTLVRESAQDVQVATGSGDVVSNYMTLPLGQPITLLLSRGTRLYFYSSSADAVASVVVQSVDSLLELLGKLLAPPLPGVPAAPSPMPRRRVDNKIGWAPDEEG